MSDLHCPATLVLARPAVHLAQAGERGDSLADSMAGRRVAAVWCGEEPLAVRTAEVAAARLGVAVSTRASLDEAYDDEPDPDLVQRHRDLFEEIADLHRGETVLVVCHERVLRIVVPTLAGNLTRTWADGEELADTGTVELENDADGWVLRRWGAVSFRG